MSLHSLNLTNINMSINFLGSNPDVKYGRAA